MNTVSYYSNTMTKPFQNHFTLLLTNPKTQCKHGSVELHTSILLTGEYQQCFISTHIVAFRGDACQGLCSKQ